MCLFSRRPDYDVEFANRPSHRKRSSTTRISETVIRDRSSSYIHQAPPRASTPIIRPVTPPRLIEAPSPPTPTRIEVVSVEESRGSPRTSRVSVSGGKKSRHGGSSRGGEEVYIERERERVRLPPQQTEPEYDTYRYVEGPKDRYADEERVERRRSRSITYETNPRLSGRLVERERVVVEDGGRRREYYRRA